MLNFIKCFFLNPLKLSFFPSPINVMNSINRILNDNPIFLFGMNLIVLSCIIFYILSWISFANNGSSILASLLISEIGLFFFHPIVM